MNKSLIILFLTLKIQIQSKKPFGINSLACFSFIRSFRKLHTPDFPLLNPKRVIILIADKPLERLFLSLVIFLVLVPCVYIGQGPVILVRLIGQQKVPFKILSELQPESVVIPSHNPGFVVFINELIAMGETEYKRIPCCVLVKFPFFVFVPFVWGESSDRFVVLCLTDGESVGNVVAFFVELLNLEIVLGSPVKKSGRFETFVDKKVNQLDFV